MMRPLPLTRLPIRTCSYGSAGLRGAQKTALRPSPAFLRRAGAVRYESTGEHSSGHISQAENEGVMFFNNVFPLKLQRLLYWSSTSHEQYLEQRGPAAIGSFDPAKAFTEAVGKDSPIKINGVTPRLKDGAAFLRFTHPPETTREEVASTVRKYLQEHPFRPWWNPFERTHARLVLGKPWIEDLYRPPSCRLRIEFEQEGNPKDGPPDLSQETLYGLFRPYGKLLEIQSQPPDSKILPKYAYVDFSSAKRAIMAKNCLHGYLVRDEDSGAILAKLKIGYERTPKANWIRDWILNHPRIVIPILIALAGTITVAIFDPMRTFFIKSHISRTFHLADNRLYKWFASQASSVVAFTSRRGKNPGYVAIVDDRRQEIDQIKTWLMETADTFIIVQGPRGSGKKELVGGQALKDRKYKLIIDCKTIQDARGDTATINATAEAVGYKPVFSWMNSISGLIDLAAKGAAGVDTGFSETLDGQLNKIFASTSTALRELALESRKKTDKDFDLDADAYLEAHPEKRPAVVIDNFLHKSTESSVIYDKLAGWAADLTSANTAHVIFLTTDVSFSKSLSKALPDRVFRQISLGDLPADAAKRFVISHLEPDSDDITQPTDDKSSQPKSKRRAVLAELDECIDDLGGRLTDLEFLARRIRAGETPKNAVDQIIHQSSSEILKMYVLSGADRKWTPQQAWTLLSQLAASDDGLLRYNEVVLHDAFAGASDGPDVAIQALEQAELISIVSANGRPHSIKPGKPVFLPAFRQLSQDGVLKARLDLALLSERLKAENASVDKAEAELHLLGELPKQPYELSARIQWLLTKLQTSHGKIEAWEKQVADLKKVLQTEF